MKVCKGLTCDEVIKELEKKRSRQRKGNEKGNKPSREKRKKYKDSTSIFENTIQSDFGKQR